jgi:hypothetical protein
VKNTHKSVETRYMEARQDVFASLKRLDRRIFAKVATGALGAVLAKGLVPPHSFTPVSVAHAAPAAGQAPAFRFAYISDSHLYKRETNDRFDRVVVIHGHTHQLLTNRIGNIHLHGLLATAWPWPYAPQGMPELTVQMNRPDPFNPHDGCGDGEVHVHPDGLADKIYNLWNRNPITVARGYTLSNGTKCEPPEANRPGY